MKRCTKGHFAQRQDECKGCARRRWARRLKAQAIRAFDEGNTAAYATLSMHLDALNHPRRFRHA